MSNEILVYVETAGDSVRQVSWEMLSKTKELASELGAEVAAVIVGADEADAANQAAQYGASKVYQLKSDQLDQYTTGGYTSAFNQLAQKVEPLALLFGNTGIGRDLAPRLAQRLGVGMLSDVTDMSVKDGKLDFVRPVYAGKALESVHASTTPLVATIRTKAFDMAEPDAAASASVEEVDVSVDPADLLAIIKDVALSVSERPDLTEADVIVSGGRGVKNAESFSMLEELADTLGAAVGASRAAVDNGYIGHEYQVGQTGKTVAPTLYIAAGISGAIQHLAGMGSSKVVVAINNDPDANIFTVSDYGIVGDLFQVIPLLTEEFKKLQ